MASEWLTIKWQAFINKFSTEFFFSCLFFYSMIVNSTVHARIAHYINALWVYSICSPEKIRLQLRFVSRATNWVDETLWSNTASTHPPIHHASSSFEPLRYNLPWHSRLWAECASVKLNQHWQDFHADGSPIPPLFAVLFCQEMFYPLTGNESLRKE